MSASPQPAPSPQASGVIAVAPSSLGSASAAVLAFAADVRAERLRPLGVEITGDSHCDAALASATRLVGAALDASAGCLDEIARALRAAAEAYGLADQVAFTAGSS
jgi:hypothetical protein